MRSAGLGAIGEYFLLRDADAQSDRVPEELRTKSSESLRIAKQRRNAAELLWQNGAPAEALQLARDAFERAATAAEQSAAEVVDQVRKQLQERPLPALDADVVPEHAGVFAALIRAHDELHRQVAPRFRSRAELAELRQRRIAAACVAVLAGLVGVYLLVRTPREVRAEASAVYSQSYPPERALDGRADTEWLLPDQATGWIELNVRPARRVGQLRLLNCHNGPFNDRATKGYRVTVLGRSGATLKTLDGEFPEFTTHPQWVTLDIGAEKVDRIRVEVRTFHLSGGGFAEIQVD